MTPGWTESHAQSMADRVTDLAERMSAVETHGHHFWERLREGASRAMAQDHRTHQIEMQLRQLRAEAIAKRQARDDRRAMRREALGLMTWLASVGVLILALLGYIPPEIAKAISSALGRVPL